MDKQEEINGESLSFEETLSRLEAERRIDPIIVQTADYLLAASILSGEKELLKQAREALMKEDPRELFLKFIQECIKDLQTAPRAERFKYATYLNDVAIMGLGIWQEDIGLTATGQDALKFTREPNWEKIKAHISEVVFGDYFIEQVSVPVDTQIWGTEFPLRMSACDASQHRFKLKAPFNKAFASPVVVNNAGGTIKTNEVEKRWTPIAVPKNTGDYEDWVILGPHDYAYMEDGDYEWAVKSSMDVGEFFVEETFIFKHGGLAKKPDVHFRDGRIYPQDKLMNCKIQNRHGELTRQALYRMVTTCKTANDLKILYCGVAKQVELKIFSTIIDWYITKVIGNTHWNPTGKAITDSEMIRYMLNCEDFSARTFNKIYVTCQVMRKFEAASNLNRRTRQQARNDLDSLNRVHHSRDITARDIVEEALKVNVVMFFAGHSTNDELYIPRYEFVMLPFMKVAEMKNYVLKVLSALRLASFDVDEDHLRGLDEPITTLVPTPLLVAHDISKKMGEELAANFAQRTTAELILRMRQKKDIV
ncbi:hypothetical protein HYW42_00840 [Candidatus Daviesbacteria bacterium]|nr:hypothetical protein [Candidatus Daviesbacteria bacterium]